MTTFPYYLTTLDYLPLKNRFIPAEVPSNKVMILLHGRGGKAEDFMWIAERFAFEDMHYLFLNSPTSYDEGYTWYEDAPEHLEGIKRSSALLTQTFDMLFSKDFDATQSFMLGFSQGALLTFEFGTRYAKKLAGYIAISGQLNDPKLLLQEMHPALQDANWLCTHGTSDEALDFNITKSQIKVLQNAGLHIDFESYDKGHSILEEEIDMIKKWVRINL
jgi:phospholipase/carboxylesterase